jgi:hypothetical protein
VPFRSLEINSEHCYPDVLPCGLIFVTGVPFCTSDVLAGQLILQFIFNCVPLMACLPPVKFSQCSENFKEKKHLAAACSIFNVMACAEF